MSTDMALVILREHKGEETVYVVPMFVLDWIKQPYGEPSQTCYQEPVPVDVLNFFEDSANDSLDDAPIEVQVTRGSPQNDRALQMVVSDSRTFGSLVDAMAHVREEDFKIVDTFNGMVY